MWLQQEKQILQFTYRELKFYYTSMGSAYFDKHFASICL